MATKDKDFEKALFFWFAALLIFLAGSEMLISCKAKKPLIETVETDTVKNDFTSVKQQSVVSLAIHDTVFVPIGNLVTGEANCDEKCNEALQRQLANLNTKKKSGNNEAGFYYDKEKKMLTAYSKLEATNSVLRDSISKIYESYKNNTVKPVLVPAEFDREQKFNLWVGRLFWLGLIIWIFLKFRKYLPV